MPDIAFVKTSLRGILIAKSERARLCFRLDFTDHQMNRWNEPYINRSLDAAIEIVEQYKKQGLEVEEK